MSFEECSKELLSESHNKALSKKIKELENFGFLSDEASEFASLKFRLIDGNVALSLRDKEKLEEYEEKYEKLSLQPLFDNATEKIKELEGLGFSVRAARRFVILKHREDNHIPLSEDEREELEGYEAKLEDQSKRPKQIISFKDIQEKLKKGGKLTEEETSALKKYKMSFFK